MRTFSHTAALVIPVVVAATLATSGANAQKRVFFPADHANTEGYSFDSRFHLSNGISRNQYFYDRRDLHLPDKARITRIGFRQDGRFKLTGRRVQLEILMGASKATPSTLSRTFAKNYAGSPVTVMNKRIVTLPSFAIPRKSPSTNIVWLQLDRPYTFDAAKSLVVDLRVFANDNGGKAFSYPLDFARYAEIHETFGVGCKTSSNSLPILTSGAAVLGTGWRYSIRSAPGNAVNIAILGSRKLPGLDLSGLGAPGCRLYVDLLIVAGAGATTAQGNLSGTIPIPNVGALLGAKVPMQCLQSDLFANKFGFVFTNGIRAQVSSNPRQGVVTASGKGDAVNGSVRSQWSLVTVFEYK